MNKLLAFLCLNTLLYSLCAHSDTEHESSGKTCQSCGANKTSTKKRKKRALNFNLWQHNIARQGADEEEEDPEEEDEVNNEEEDEHD